MITSALRFTLIFGLLSGVAACKPSPEESASSAVSADAMGSLGLAPDWQLRDVEGNLVKSAQFKGKVVVVDFWATWCGPCLQEIPGYIQLQEKYGKDGLVIVGVSLDRIKPAEVGAFAKKRGMNYVVVMGDDSIVEAFGGFTAIPTTFIIGRDGQILDKKTGSVETAVYEQRLKKFLN